MASFFYFYLFPSIFPIISLFPIISSLPNTGDMWALGVRESYKSKLQVLVSAAEAAEMILRVDDIIKCAPRERHER